MPAVAISNNDVAFLAWKPKKKIDGCLGFAVYRTDSKGEETPLPAWVGFQGEQNPTWAARTTESWPVQKLTWRDLTAKRGETYTYRIVPLKGKPGQLAPDAASQLVTNAVTITANRGSASAYFNRGILSTQSLVHQVPKGPHGIPNYLRLKNRIDQPGDPLRNRLSGELREAMLELFARAKREHGHLYLALYELTDPELEQALIDGKSFVHVVLSNTGADDGENQPARQALHEAGVDVTDRFVGSEHIGHNKFAVYVDRHGKAAAVWTGSTNWTDTGLCAQSNNGLWIESADLAALYLDYWQRLKDDGGDQSAAFREANDQAHAVATNDSDITLWFSPNTRLKRKPKDNPSMPNDMQAVFDAIGGAKQAILFLVFQPGSPSVIERIAEAQRARPALFVHGAATDPGAVGDYSTHLFHRSATPADTDVVAAAAIDDQFGYWERELLKAGPSAHAIIHDKIVVIDPFSDDCVVITGSHNLGYRASYNNDENLLIVRKNRPLAAAYAAHVMDIYDHYRWRFMLQRNGTSAWSGLVRDDRWQNKYFDDGGAARELAFWMNANGP